MALQLSLAGVIRITALTVCLGASVGARDAEAQLNRTMNAKEASSLAQACGRTGTRRACFALFRSGLAWLGDLVLAELEAAPGPPVGPVVTPTPGKGTPQVIWDGTFAHPNAPKFSALRSYVPAAARTSAEACSQLPATLKADNRRLLRLTCEAEQELLAYGSDQWPDERKELQRIRELLASCLPPAGPNPCATP